MLKIFKKKKASLKKLWYLNCKTLPMRQLIDATNTGDARYIFKSEPEEWPEDFNAKELVSDFEKIIVEHDKLRGKNTYENHLQDEDLKMYQELKLKALKVCILALTLGNKEGANEIMLVFKFKFELTIKELEKQIKILSNWFVLHAEKNKDNEERLQIDWFYLIAYIESNSDIKVDYNCPVAQYYAYDRIVEQILIARKKAYENVKAD